jgi:hypothetical protein
MKNEMPTSDPRLLGRHADCGGEVYYYSTRTRGTRICSKCGSGTFLSGTSPTLVGEIK